MASFGLNVSTTFRQIWTELFLIHNDNAFYMYFAYFDNNSGQADKQAVQTVSREVSRIITEQVKKFLSGSEEKKKEPMK